LLKFTHWLPTWKLTPRGRSPASCALIDAMRADRLSASGYRRPTTPFLDRMAREGVVFENAFSTAPWTVPAMFSLITGLYPGQHAMTTGETLGGSVVGHQGFDFDIRIQMGAGAYICGEETALINSCEGLRGDPRNRPPFPAQQGYLGCPTVVNNVETLACVTRILEIGSASFGEYGSKQTSGTKLLSISGDVRSPGVYEVSFGTSLREMLELAKGTDAIAVQVGGPSGRMVGPADFDRKICYDDLATGGALIVFGSGRDLIAIARTYLEFFTDESCGYCTPCRVGNVLLAQVLDRILGGRGEPADLKQIEEIGLAMKTMSRCGLGQTSANPALTSLQNFRPLYEARVKPAEKGRRRSFDLEAAVAVAQGIRTGGCHE